MPDQTGLAVRKTITVGAPIDVAFEVFTRDIGSWWPLKTHSVLDGRANTVVMEPCVGGRLFERTPDGEEAPWGQLTAWDPPSRVAFTWHPGSPEERETNVDVRFSADGDRTRVELVHTGWEVLGDDAGDTMRSYDNGWPPVLGQYVDEIARRAG